MGVRALLPTPGHWVEVPSSRYVEVDEALIPTGTIAPVEGTVLDLRQPTRLGAVLELCPGGEYAGFSHTFLVEDNLQQVAHWQEDSPLH